MEFQLIMEFRSITSAGSQALAQILWSDHGVSSQPGLHSGMGGSAVIAAVFRQLSGVVVEGVVVRNEVGVAHRSWRVGRAGVRVSGPGAAVLAGVRQLPVAGGGPDGGWTAGADLPAGASVRVRGAAVSATTFSEQIEG